MAVRSKWAMAGGLALAAMAVLLAWQGRALYAQAQVGAAYGARIGCSCRYVEGRGMDSCQEDKEPGMALVQIEDVPPEKAVRATVPLIANRTARFREGWGCLLEPG